jgi:hypothetical protein
LLRRCFDFTDFLPHEGKFLRIEFLQLCDDSSALMVW